MYTYVYLIANHSIGAPHITIKHLTVKSVENMINNYTTFISPNTHQFCTLNNWLSQDQGHGFFSINIRSPTSSFTVPFFVLQWIYGAHLFCPRMLLLLIHFLFGMIFYYFWNFQGIHFKLNYTKLNCKQLRF